MEKLKTALLKQAEFKVALLVISLVILLVLPTSLPAQIGVIDFRPYWSSSFLLARGEDFSDPSNLDAVERDLTGWDEPYTMYAWFAPTGNLVLLPYTLFPFACAAYLWLITNITVVFFSATLLWSTKKTTVWIPLAAAFGFSMTLISIYYGQVNTLVVLGLALYLFFKKSSRDVVAGASLVLTTIKPHLVILTLPLLILDIVWRRQWRVFAGFVCTLVACVLVLYTIYPLWVVSFWQVVTSGMSSFRETPTIPGLLVHAGNSDGKLLWMAGLFLAIIVWWKLKERLNQRVLVDVSILTGMLISPIGWSYDQIVLLIPLLHVLEWMIDGLLTKKESIAVALMLIITNFISFYERTLSVSEVWFFWIPLAAIIIYGFAWRQAQNRVGGAFP